MITVPPNRHVLTGNALHPAAAKPRGPYLQMGVGRCTGLDRSPIETLNVATSLLRRPAAEPPEPTRFRRRHVVSGGPAPVFEKGSPNSALGLGSSLTTRHIGYAKECDEAMGEVVYLDGWGKPYPGI
jgi:hypothetical protein